MCGNRSFLSATRALCQRSRCAAMEAFLVRRSSASAQPLAGTATREQRQADAARIGLAVSAAKRGIGRPPRQALYEDALRDAIRAGTLPAEVTSTAAPDWWRAGLPLTRAQRQQAEDLLEAARVPAGQAENAEALEGTLGPSEEGNQPATDTDAGQPHRKKYKAAPPEAKAWFLQYARLQSDLHQWSFVPATLRPWLPTSSATSMRTSRGGGRRRQH